MSRFGDLLGGKKKTEVSPTAKPAVEQEIVIKEDEHSKQSHKEIKSWSNILNTKKSKK